jgi:hypothetical protein
MTIAWYGFCIRSEAVRAVWLVAVQKRRWAGCGLLAIGAWFLITIVTAGHHSSASRSPSRATRFPAASRDRVRSTVIGMQAPPSRRTDPSACQDRTEDHPHIMQIRMTSHAERPDRVPSDK